MQYKENQYIFPGVILLILFCCCSPAGRSPDKKVLLNISDGKKLLLLIPAAWKIESKRSNQKILQSVTILPSEGDEFKLGITPLVSRFQNKNFYSRDEISQIVMRMKQTIENRALEKNIQILTLEGKHCYGQYFFATDKSPKPGKYPFLVKAGIGGGNVLLIVTILHRKKDSFNIKKIFQMLSRLKLITKKQTE